MGNSRNKPSGVALLLGSRAVTHFSNLKIKKLIYGIHKERSPVATLWFIWKTRNDLGLFQLTNNQIPRAAKAGTHTVPLQA